LNNLLKIVGLQRIGKISGEQVKRDFTTKKTLRKPGEIQLSSKDTQEQGKRPR